MSKENITFRLESEKRLALDAIAAGLDRDRTYVLNEAIDLKIFSIPFDIHSYPPTRTKDFGRKPELSVGCWLHLFNAMSYCITAFHKDVHFVELKNLGRVK